MSLTSVKKELRSAAVVKVYKMIDSAEKPGWLEAALAGHFTVLGGAPANDGSGLLAAVRRWLTSGTWTSKKVEVVGLFVAESLFSRGIVLVLQEGNQCPHFVYVRACGATEECDAPLHFSFRFCASFEWMPSSPAITGRPVAAVEPLY